MVIDVLQRQVDPFVGRSENPDLHLKGIPSVLLVIISNATIILIARNHTNCVVDVKNDESEVPGLSLELH